MLRATPSILFLALASLSLFDGRLWADEPKREAGSGIDEANVSFERRQFTVGWYKGKLFLDGIEVSSRSVDLQSKEVRLIETFDEVSFPSGTRFLGWARKLKGTRTYTYDEVTHVTDDGSKTIKPLVFFDKDQRVVLDLVWHTWLDRRQSELEQSNRLNLAREQEARRYQQQGELQNLQSQALLAQANAAERAAQSLAVISGETSLWEVELVPVGSATSSLYVNVHGRTSLDAANQAIRLHPGYEEGTIRKLTRY